MEIRKQRLTQSLFQVLLGKESMRYKLCLNSPSSGSNKMASNGHGNSPSSSSFYYSKFELIKWTRNAGLARKIFMEGGTTTPKVAAGLLIARPLLLKAGIPLFLSVTGFVCARILIAVRNRCTRRAGNGNVSSPTASMTMAHGTDSADENQGDIADDGSLCCDGLISTFTDSDNFGHDLHIEDSQYLLKLQLLALSSEITNLRERESILESRFLRYYELKERGLEILEIGYRLQLGSARLEMLQGEVARMEGDCKFLAEFSEQIRKALEELCYRQRVEKMRIRAKLKKMKRRVEAGGIKLREGRLKMEEKERELVDMRKENEELHKKLSTAEASAEAEETELARLRWSNASLKNELTKNHGQEKQEDPASSVNEEEEAPGACLVTGVGDNHVPRSPKKGRPPRIMKKLKRWGGWIGGDRCEGQD